MGFKVTPDELRRTGNDIVDTADEANANVDAHSGVQDADSAANRNFATAAAIAACESGWERALTVFGTKMAVAGDKLVINASQYAGNEHTTAGRMREN